MNDSLPGLSPHDLGATPAERRRSLLRLPDAALEARLVRLARTLREKAAEPIAKAAGLPLGEVIASPFALRAVAMGVSVGAVSRHRELRRDIDWTETMAVDPAVRDPDHDVWDRGVLRTGKYQGFTAEAPLPVYDPSHVAKWGPHEMMHRAAGFFFRPGLTRWELYLGARLNELVPVVLFYGPEQAMRLDEGAFDRQGAGERPAADPAQALWRSEDESALRVRARRALPILRDSIEWFERELATIDRELATGQRIRTPHPFLDTSSDATAYVVGHHTRLRQTAVGEVLRKAPGRIADVVEYRDRVEVLFDWLLFHDVQIDLERAALRRRARVAQDLLLRAAHLGEGVEVDLAPLLEVEDPDAIRDALPKHIGREEAEVVLEDGSPEGWAQSQLAEGLEHALPCTCRLLEDGWIARFARSEHVLGRASLATRAMRFLRGDGAPEAVLDLLRLEEAIVASKRDDAVERLFVPFDTLPNEPDELADGEIVASRHLRRLDLAHDALQAHATASGGAAPTLGEGAQTLLVVAFEEAVSVVPVPPEVADAVENAHGGSADAATLEDSWLRELVSAGVIGWRTRRPGQS